MNPQSAPARQSLRCDGGNPALDRIDSLARLAADSLRNADRYPFHARTYRECAATYNLVAGSTASDLGLASMYWDAPSCPPKPPRRRREFPVPIKQEVP